MTLERVYFYVRMFRCRGGFFVGSYSLYRSKTVRRAQVTGAPLRK